MIPLVDLHCHLLAGLDDGPRTDAEALEMCRLAYADGTRVIAAGAHQNERYPANTPERLTTAAARLAEQLRAAELPLLTFPCAEIMAHPDLAAAWKQGTLLGVAGRRHYLLVELPHQGDIDLRHTVRQLRASGVRPILAHPERCADLLHEPGRIEELIELGCLVQVSAKSLTQPASRHDERAVRDWLKRGVVHVLGSDGHSLNRRPPRLADAYRQVVRWAGAAVADRVASSHGMAITQGLPLRLPSPQTPRTSWFSRLW